jgi:hypothetical protein
MKTKFLITSSLLASGISMLAQIHQTGSTRTGFNTAAPANKVEITSSSGDPYHGSANGSSGLRLTNLTNTNTALTNTLNKVLSVDANGDVILVNDNAGSGTFGGAQNGCSVNGSNVVELGNATGGTSAQLLSNREVPLNNFGLLFSGNQTSSRFKIGGTSLTSNARFEVEHHFSSGGSSNQKAFHCLSDAEGSTYNKAIYAETRDKNSSVFSPLNIALHAKTQGLGFQVGMRVESISSANSNQPTHGIEVSVDNSSGSTGTMTGISVGAGNSSNPVNFVFGLKSTANGGIINTAGIFQSHNPPTNNTSNTGVFGDAGNGAKENIGVRGEGFSGTKSGTTGNPIRNYGAMFAATGGNGINNVSLIDNMGVYASAVSTSGSSSSNNYGVYARATNNLNAQCTNYGIWAEAFDPFNTQISWAGWFDGDVHIEGTNSSRSGYALRVNGDAFLSAGSTWQTSDQRFKTNIQKLENASDKLKKLNGYTYLFKTEEFKKRNFSKTEQIGLIAQELKEVFPQLVREGSDGYLAVNYEGMIPVLLEGFKEQQAQIEAQQQQIKELVNALLQNSATDNKNSSAAGNQTSANVGTPTTINLTDKNIIVLNQNVPNPFAESTEITYNIPQSFTKAQLIFSTYDGKVIKVVDITEKGSGKLNVFANDLSHGMYSYQLVVDEKVIDTKKMIRE